MSAPHTPHKAADEEVLTRGEFALSVLDELAAAWRGSWADFDGRTLRAQLDDWKLLLRAEVNDLATPDELASLARGLRTAWDICPNGRGHWREFCADCEESRDA